MVPNALLVFLSLLLLSVDAVPQRRSSLRTSSLEPHSGSSSGVGHERAVAEDTAGVSRDPEPSSSSATGSGASAASTDNGASGISRDASPAAASSGSVSAVPHASQESGASGESGAGGGEGDGTASAASSEQDDIDWGLVNDLVPYFHATADGSVLQDGWTLEQVAQAKANESTASGTEEDPAAAAAPPPRLTEVWEPPLARVDWNKPIPGDIDSKFGPGDDDFDLEWEKNVRRVQGQATAPTTARTDHTSESLSQAGKSAPSLTDFLDTEPLDRTALLELLSDGRHSSNRRQSWWHATAPRRQFLQPSVPAAPARAFGPRRVSRRQAHVQPAMSLLETNRRVRPLPARARSGTGGATTSATPRKSSPARRTARRPKQSTRRLSKPTPEQLDPWNAQFLDLGSASVRQTARGEAASEGAAAASAVGRTGERGDFVHAFLQHPTPRPRPLAIPRPDAEAARFAATQVRAKMVARRIHMRADESTSYGYHYRPSPFKHPPPPPVPPPPPPPPPPNFGEGSNYSGYRFREEDDTPADPEIPGKKKNLFSNHRFWEQLYPGVRYAVGESKEKGTPKFHDAVPGKDSAPRDAQSSAQSATDTAKPHAASESHTSSPAFAEVWSNTPLTDNHPLRQPGPRPVAGAAVRFGDSARTR